MHTLFNLLPDLCGVLLAAVGLSITVFKEALDRFERKRWHRGLLAITLLVVGICGTISASLQKRDAERKQTDLGNNIDRLQSLVSSYGPKLDQLIARSNNPGVRNEASGLKASLGRAVIDFFDVRLPTGNAARPSTSCVPDSGRPYSCMTDKELSTLLFSEATRLRNLAEPLSDRPVTASAQSDFTGSFVTCCMRDIGDFRSAVFDRLGSGSQEERAAWQEIALYRENPTRSLSPKQIASYATYLQHWGEALATRSQ